MRPWHYQAAKFSVFFNTHKFKAPSYVSLNNTCEFRAYEAKSLFCYFS